MNFTVFMSFFLVAVSLQSTTGNGIHLETQPSNEIGDSTQVLELSCQVEASDNLQKTLVIMITKDNQDNTIATVNAGHSAWASSKRYKVEGSIDKESSNRFLNVTVTSPGHNDTGAYTCLVLSLAEDGQIKKESASEYITWKESLESKFFVLERKLNDLVEKNEDQITAITALETSNKQQKSKIIALETAEEQEKSKITALETENKLLTSKITALETECKQQKSQITDLKAEDKQRKSQISVLAEANEQQKSKMIDLARMNEQGKMKDKQQALQIESLKGDYKNQSLKISALFAEDKHQKSEISDLVKLTNLMSFNLKKLQNSPIAFRTWTSTISGFIGTVTSWSNNPYNNYFQKGGAFNPSSGVFTAPSDGLYAFNVYVEISSSNNVDVNIRHNGDIVGRVWAKDDDDTYNSSYGTILELKHQDTVSLYVGVWTDRNKYVRFFFSGYRVTKT